jgi:hypothetical protein
MRKHPRHYTGKLKAVKESATIYGRYNPYELDSEFSYLICDCDNNAFRIYLSEHPEVKCTCSSCGKEYLVYDASYYAKASEYNPEKGKFNKWISKNGKDVFQVIVVWLYPEDPDDQDDVDWFVLIAKDPETNEYTEVANEEIT